MPKNIAIIGSGTGLTTAWALDKQKKFNVTVFEASNRLGGHAHTISIHGVPVEAGAEFIGNPDLYPLLHRLFTHLKVPLRAFQLNMDLHDLRDNDHLVLPPIYKTSDGKEKGQGCWGSLLSFFKPQTTQPEIEISFETLFTDFCDLLRMYEAINKAKREINELQTLQQFVEEFCGRSEQKRQFADNVIYPLIAAAWGFPIETAKNFYAHYAMNYLIANNTWYEAVDGLSSYINKLEARCKNTNFQRNTAIEKIIPVVSEGKTQYQLRKKDGTLVCNEESKPILYDDVMVTTSAEITANMLPDIEQLSAVKELLAKVTYIDTTVVFHQDPSYMSDKNTVVHTRFDGKRAANTMCKHWKFPQGEIPVMKTWILPDQPMPNNIIKIDGKKQIIHYRHPVMDSHYYNAQMALHAAQGKYGLWFGGILAGFNDSHESGISVARDVATKLCKREGCLKTNARLAVFNMAEVDLLNVPHVNNVSNTTDTKNTTSTAATVIELSHPRPPRQKREPVAAPSNEGANAPRI